MIKSSHLINCPVFRTLGFQHTFYSKIIYGVGSTRNDDFGEDQIDLILISPHNADDSCGDYKEPGKIYKP